MKWTVSRRVPGARLEQVRGQAPGYVPPAGSIDGDHVRKNANDCPADRLCVRRAARAACECVHRAPRTRARATAVATVPADRPGRSLPRRPVAPVVPVFLGAGGPG